MSSFPKYHIVQKGIRCGARLWLRCRSEAGNLATWHFLSLGKMLVVLQELRNFFSCSLKHFLELGEILIYRQQLHETFLGPVYRLLNCVYERDSGIGLLATAP